MPPFLRPLRAAGLFAALLALAGCGGGAKSVPLAGSVIYDGNPVDGGSIVFVPEASGTELVQAGATITAGKYAFTADTGPKPGKYKVEITWNAVPKGVKVDPDMPAARSTQMLPAKYNTATTLTHEVKAGETTKDFPLTK